MQHEQLIKAQQDRETQAVSDGIERYRERVSAMVERGGFDKHDQARQLVSGAIPIVSVGISEWRENAAAQKGRKPKAYEALSLIDPDVVAAATLTAIFRAQTEGGAIKTITLQIGRFMEAQLEAQAVAEKDAKVIKRYQKLAEGITSEARLKARWDALVKENEAALQWIDDTASLVGKVALNVALIKLEGLFYKKTISQQGKTHACVFMTPEAEQALCELEDEAALRFLPFRPMVSEPRKWERMNTGGYYDLRLSRLVPMVRLRDKEARKRIRKALKDGSMSKVVKALNAMQGTRFAIDKRMLPIIEWALEAGIRPAKSFPTYDIPVMPEKIKKDEWAKLEPAVAMALSRRRRSLKKNISALRNGLKSFKDDMAEARDMAKYEAFYLPVSLDFRGRTYTVPHFNFQRSDHHKALFRFAEGKPLGEHGGKWLKVQIANTGDFPNLLPNATSAKMSKATFEERLLWVDLHHDQIIAAAADPAGTTGFWAEADSAFCFLQACMEYAEWAASDFSPTYVSTIAGAADGSCSGLQHYACITRSRKEADLVNLTDRETVGDVYQTVADGAIPMLQKIIDADFSVTEDQLALLTPTERVERLKKEARDKLMKQAAILVLAQPFGRSELKRNVMTYFYGSARFGMRDQQLKDLMMPLADKVALGEVEAHPYEMMTERTDKGTKETAIKPDGGFTCASLIASVAWDSVTKAAEKAQEAAEWVQHLAGTLAHESLSMNWTTPSGFPVSMRYVEYTHKEVNLWLYDRSIKVPAGSDKVDEEGNILSRVRVLLRSAATGRVDKKGMRNASSPNLIHSNDGSHLHLSVDAAADEGIDSFMMIHDSFGTHLGNMERFNAIIREQLVASYADYCPLEDLLQEAKKVLSDEGLEALKPLPAKGDWDLTEILKAKYAFA